MKKFLSFTLALAMTLCLASPALAADQSLRGTPWEDMEYVHYDPEDFYAAADELTALAGGTDADAILALYDELYNEFVAIDTYYNIAELHYSADVTDGYWSDEDLYTEKLWYAASDALCSACYAVLQGPCADAFGEHVGADAARSFAGYASMPDQEIELLDREAELENQYNELVNASYQLTYTYKNRDWTQDMLDSSEGDRLYARDFDGYWEVYDGLMAAANALIGPVFVELVQVRAELADIWGYDSYADYAYALVYGRDYTTADAQALCEAVKSFSADYYDGLYYSDLWYMSDSVTPAMDSEALVAALGEHVGKIDPSLDEAWQFMADNGLYDLPDGDNAYPGGYTTTLALYDSPFIYDWLYGDCYDLDGLSHEFGHFADAYFNAIPNVLTSVGSYDLFEVHSTGLEALFTTYYDEIYNADGSADIAAFIALGGLIESVLDGCAYDEFQRQVYADPDMTLDEINELYTAIRADYGMYEDGVDYAWMYISHNFDSPLYYISYAVSALAALQIWDMAQTDFQTGVDAYLAVLERGAYDDGYMTVLSDCGLRLFTEDGMVEDVCRPVLDYLEDLEYQTMDLVA